MRVTPRVPNLATALYNVLFTLLRIEMGHPRSKCFIHAPAADVGAAGVVLLTMLIGEPPFPTVTRHPQASPVTAWNDMLQRFRSWYVTTVQP